jgi:SAM-dependent methyltransferase
VESVARDCAVCAHPLGGPVFTSPGSWSITSLCVVKPFPSAVYFCCVCGHLQTPPLADLASYYESEYRILIDSEEEDQLYQVVGDRQVFRLDHQAETLLRKLSLPPAAAILDYGCAKGGTLKRALAKRSDLQVHLFDVSEMYLPFWRSFVAEERWALYRPRDSWAGRFDAVTSFFSLEHVVEPRTVMAEIARLLKPGGVFYGIVPNVFTNTADFVVSDHVNHFSAASLATLLESSGFRVVEIDDQAHLSAFVFVARSGNSAVAPVARIQEVAAVGKEVAGIADYWRALAERVQAFERGHADCPAAVYGSGFYGTYLATCLQDAGAIRCFIDRSPFRQGRTLFDRPILAPESLPDDITTLYVGLNPMHARTEIGKVSCWSSRPLNCFYP